MTISSFFEPVESVVVEKGYLENSIFNQLSIHHHGFPELTGIQIALVGLKESRGASRSESIARASSEIREKLYQLKKGGIPYKIADLGDLISGNILNDTYQNIRQVGDYL